jgi:flagellar hook-length control protein FliK
MIVLDFQSKPSASSSSVLPQQKNQEDGDFLTFSTLLQDFQLPEDEKSGSLNILSLQEDLLSEEVPKKSLAELLKGEQNSDVPIVESEDAFNDIFPSLLDEKSLKILIANAKQYLKEKIVSSEGFKRAEINKLPKTLQGLMQVAKKLKIDISKISIEEVMPKDNLNSLSFSLSDLKSKNNTKLKLHKKVQGPKNEKKFQRDSNGDDSVEFLSKKEQKLLKELPLFKKSTLTFAKEVSTQQIVDRKIAVNLSHNKAKNSKSTEDKLQILLSGERTLESKNSFLKESLTQESAQQKSIAITPKSELSLETLLVGEKKSTFEVKTDKTEMTHPLKAESFEVKLNEAKQMIKYLSHDVKQTIDNYKAPFTRVRIQLHPQQLGDIEVTVVQRGKNLHLNLSSNNSAINTLSMHMQDLKVQLQNSGINNATLNFSNNSNSGEQNAQQQQQHNRKDAEAEYNYFENDEQNEEIRSSLEIVVPYYA